MTIAAARLWRRAAVGALLWPVLAWLVSGCVSEGDPPTGIRVENDLPRDVVVLHVIDATEREAGRVARGESMSLDLGEPGVFEGDRGFLCTRADLVARTDDGAEVARVEPPVCQRDVVLLSEHPPGPASSSP